MAEPCIIAISYRADEPLVTSSTIDYEPLVASSVKMDEAIAALSARYDTPIIVASARHDEPLVAYSSMICTVASGYYLKVEPEVIWLIEANDFEEDILVKSNVTWTIE